MRGREQIALAGLATTLVVTAAMLGGAPRWAACLAVALALAGTAPYLTSRRTARPGPLLIVLAVAAVATALALLPLPDMIAEQVAAPKLALVRDHARAFGESTPAWCVASYDPPATLLELAKLAGYLAVAWTAVRIAAERRARPWLASTVVGAALAVVLVTAAHDVLGASRLYGVFESPITDRPPSPLINVNHLAALAALATPLAMALVVAWRGPLRAAALAATLTLIAATLLTGSRGGLVGLVAGVVVVVTLLIAQRRTGPSDELTRTPMAVAVPTVAVALCAVIGLAVVSGRDVAREIRDTDTAELHDPRSKYQVWGNAVPLVTENRWLGIGRGSFEGTFPRLNPIGDTTYAYAENTYLQVVIDWGLPGAAAVLIALAILGRAALRRWRHGPVEAGALGALTSIAIHELADFSVEMPVVAMATIVTAALLVPARLASVAGRRGPVARRVLLTRLGLVAGGALILILAGSPLGRSARADRDRLPLGPDRAAAARAALARHPADGLAAGHAAQALFARRDPRSPAVIARALYLRPLHPGLHQLAARMLLASRLPAGATIDLRRDQAQLELGIALTWARDIEPILDDVLAAFPAADDAARALPVDPRQIWRMRRALIARGRRDVMLAYLVRLSERFPDSEPVQLSLAQNALALDQPALALPAAQAAHHLRPTTLSAVALAQALTAHHRVTEAVDVLRDAPAGEPAHEASAAILLAGLVGRLGRPHEAQAVLVDAARRVRASAEAEARVRTALAGVEDALGNANQAAWQRRRAAELRGTPRETP